MKRHPLIHTTLMSSICLALAGSLAACGGGGGGNGLVRPNLPPPPSKPAQPTYTWPQDNILGPTGAKQAHAAGFTGQGVKVAVMDSGIDPSLPDFQGRSITFHSFLPGGSTTPNDTFGHGSGVAGTGFGSPSPGFGGGVAPGADLYIGQICASESAGCVVESGDANYFFDRGVRLFNYSTGASTTNGAKGLDPSTLAPEQAMFQPLVDGDALFVWATGNAGVNTLAREAALPHYFPTLQPGWLAVAGVEIDPQTGQVAGLLDDSHAGTDGNKAVVSAACGIAAEWCLVAPGEADVPEQPNTVYYGGWAVGTSISTAIVTGVATLVSQAYPWMTGHNIQQTLLTTATHLTNNPDGSVTASYTPGTVYTPNATYGWGLVNVERAIHGPGEFTGAFDANVGSDQSTFGNVISGPGSLVLSGTGSGSLTLSKDNTYTGGTTINSGTLVIDGSVASDVTLNGGSLAGTGTVQANVANTAGTVVSQGSRAGEGLTITGNLTDGASSTTAVALGDPLHVGGAATLAGTMEVLGAPKGYTVQSTEPLIDYGSHTGTFATTTFASGVFYTGTLNYTPTQTTVSLTQVSAQAVGQALPQASPQAKAVGRNLGQALDVSNEWFEDGAPGHQAWFQDAGEFLAAPDAAVAVNGLDSLSGEIYADSRAVEFEQSLAADHALATRQQALAHEHQAGVWVQAVGADGGLSRNGYDGLGYRASGEMAGFDMPLGDAFSAGVAGGSTRAWTNSAGLGGSVSARNTFGAVYGRWNAPDRFYVEGRVSFADAQDDVTRDLDLGGTSRTVAGDHSDHITMATVEAGKALSMVGSTVTPYVSVTGMRLRQSAFAEQGSAMALDAPGQTHDATLGTLGVRATRDFDLDGHRTWLNGYVAYQRVLSGANLAMDASFVGVPGTAFQAQGANLPRNVGIAGANWTVQLTRQWSGFAGASYQAGNESAHQLQANVGVRFRF